MNSLKLNLGCGIYYKPGYVNIDKYESLVADEQADLFILPYSDNSIEEIEASHIIEHFDFIHIPYLLAEWWRVLKPGGYLHIEIPNLLRSTIKLHFGNKEQSIRTGRFLFGVDSPGNFHKAGFTYRILRRYLNDNGFVKIKRERQQSFKTEPGLRLSAVKSSQLTNLLGNLRVKILHEFHPPNTFFYTSIETNVINTLQFQNIESLKQILAKISIFHPKIALILSQELPKSKQKEILPELYMFMDKHEFPSLFYENWIRRAKFKKNLLQEYYQFMEYWSNRIVNLNLGVTDFSNYFAYLLSTKITHHIEYFSLESLTLENQKWCNKGIKAFHTDSKEKAQENFEMAIKINPSNEIANWNLARIYGNTENHRKCLESYKIVMELIRDKTLRKKLMKEFNAYSSTRQCPSIPIQIRY